MPPTLQATVAGESLFNDGVGVVVFAILLAIGAPMRHATIPDVPTSAEAGMPAFDSIAHSFSTVSTGGFAIYDASFTQYQSPGIEAVAVVFMLLGSLNFALHFRAWRQLSDEPYTSNSEVRAFLVTVLALSAFIAHERRYEARGDQLSLSRVEC